MVREGNLQVSFNGGIAPQKLPRDELAPVTVLMDGKITTTDRSAPPKLEKIILAINKEGVIDTKGLPTCSLAKLNSLSSAQAKKACAGALIGHGNVTSRVSLPGPGGVRLERRTAGLQRQAAREAGGAGAGRLRRRRCRSPT